LKIYLNPSNPSLINSSTFSFLLGSFKVSATKKVSNRNIPEIMKVNGRVCGYGKILEPAIKEPNGKPINIPNVPADSYLERKTFASLFFFVWIKES